MSTQRKLARLSDRLRRDRAELAVVEEQLEALDAEAADARSRSLVSETPLAAREATTATRHADAMRKRRDDLQAAIARGEAESDELLDRLAGSGSDR